MMFDFTFTVYVDRPVSNVIPASKVKVAHDTKVL